LLAETGPQKRRKWIAALDKIESLRPRDCGTGGRGTKTVRKSSRRLGSTSATSTGSETAKTARELYEQMLRLHPQRMNVNALWTSARAIKG
jgi:hypothetical protein